MREGLMDDIGWHEIDETEEFVEKYCHNCSHDSEDGCEIHEHFTCNGDDFDDYRM